MSARRVINAAGKLTALGGSAQSDAVATAQHRAATEHVDLAELRETASRQIADYCGAEAACITSGAAAGLAIATAALVAGTDPIKTAQLPQTGREYGVILQGGHNINFGAPVEQMIRLGGGTPWVVGRRDHVTEEDVTEALSRNGAAAMFYIQSHHCVQTNQVSLTRCLALCLQAGVPLVVDAAAEEDLHRYVDAGAAMVIYSGGKAFGGPTCGFIVGDANLIAGCEAQFSGIARSMKVGKESIAGLLVALEEYTASDETKRLSQLETRNKRLVEMLADIQGVETDVQPDEAGRSFSRVAVRTNPPNDIGRLVEYLRSGEPSIRTRNHHLPEGYVLIDPRELRDEDIDTIAVRIKAFTGSRE